MSDVSTVHFKQITYKFKNYHYGTKPSSMAYTFFSSREDF